MTGSVQQKNGTYYAILQYKNKQQQKKYKWIPTGLEIKGNKLKAKAMIPEFIETYQHLEYKEADDSKILFADAIKQWLVRKKNRLEGDKLARSTYESQTIYVNKHIIPYFEKLNLYIDDVTPKHILDYYDYKFNGGRCDKKSGGLNVQSIKKHSMVFKQVFTDALIAEQITRNPASAVPLPKQEQTMKAVFLTGEEANRLLQAFTGNQLQAMVYVTLYYGLRRSEALGLKWSAVNFEEGKITIDHTVVKNLTVEYKDKTKTKTSMGDFPLLEDVKEVLLRVKAEQTENRKTFGNTYYESDYVFVWKNGNLYKPDYITRTFMRVLAKHRLPPMRFHDLRHSTASILHDKGWSLKDIQDWLRHADIETTGNIYTHISNQRKQASAKDLNKTFVI